MRGPIRRTLRSLQLRVNQTDAETKLWNRVRNRQIDGNKFVRQQPIGRYICDFVCRQKLVVIEVDGDNIQGQRGTKCVTVICARRVIA
jgi:very-short-patch-repair endonuclease